MGCVAPGGKEVDKLWKEQDIIIKNTISMVISCWDELKAIPTTVHNWALNNNELGNSVAFSG